MEPSPRGRSRGRGEKKSSEKTPAAPQSPFAAEGTDGNWQGGRGTARGRGVRPDIPAAAGLALKNSPAVAARGRGVRPDIPVAAGLPLKNSPAVAARGRGTRQDSPAAAGRALLRVPLTVQPGQVPLSVQPGQESVVAMASTLASTHVATKDESGAEAIQSVAKSTPRPPIVQRAILKTKPDSLDSKKGSSGHSVEIATNYFKMYGKPAWRLLQYRVDFKPEEDNTAVRKRIVRDLTEGLGKFMFDGSILFTTALLTDNKNTPLVLQTVRNADKCPVEVTFKLVGEVLPTEHHYLQFFNIVLRQCLEKLKLQLLGRNYYDPGAARILKEFKLELWPGYVTSIRQHENDVLLCCEISTKVLRIDTVLDQLKECYKKDPKNWQLLAQKVLLGAIVITRYNNKTYRIDEICFDKKPTDKFEMKDGSMMDYREYYLSKHDKKIEDADQPLLVSMPKLRERRGGNDSPVYLVPELCYMTGLTDEQRANFKLMKAMAEYTRQTPDKRVDTLNNFSKRVNDNPEIKQLLTDWNLKFSEDLQKFQARILKPETIYGAKGSKFIYSESNADWGKAFNKWKVVSTVTVPSWAIVYSKKDEPAVRNFLKLLVPAGPPAGIFLPQPKLFEIVDNRPSNYMQQLNKVVDENPAIVMVVVPNNKGEHYHAVKKLCCVEKPTPSQVMTYTVISKERGLGSVCSKVAMQMCCKLGGEPWNIDFPLKDTMIMGYNANSDSSKKGTDVGALVSSLNPAFSKYSSTCIFRKSDEDVIREIGPAVLKALRRYREANGKLPIRIIMYRDGLGEGQIEYAKDKEIVAIKKVFKDNGLEDLKFTYIIVSKRINTRFFMGGDKPVNPPSGTVVDDVVTLPERYDFFLISQSVRQGTVNPTSYNVIEDKSGLKPDQIQKLTYKLTHLYYNWSGTVRVPAPCQYAHKLAFLVGQSLHKPPAEELESQLFYL